ncbi:hypothetical protein K2F43_06155 [Clostridium estertheticum]|uniref:hypothetical protein n=1 Tax=Clostridium estertheticum TaxID=238834 RepID=UPI001C6E651E|nr:hypothetical protein [Clostridium estertheticum]MBW9170789.1 hypothetical protein [Clostridium estertheticum]WLC74372.1 hypothetical protein KTC99_16600 [Clostridium estertheticum]
MIIKKQYTTEDEKHTIITKNNNLILIEVQELFEGKFLIFSDVPIEKKIVYVNIPKKELEISTQRIQALEKSNAELMVMVTTMAAPTV